MDSPTFVPSSVQRHEDNGKCTYRTEQSEHYCSNCGDPLLKFVTKCKQAADYVTCQTCETIVNVKFRKQNSYDT